MCDGGGTCVTRSYIMAPSGYAKGENISKEAETDQLRSYQYLTMASLTSVWPPIGADVAKVDDMLAV